MTRFGQLCTRLVLTEPLRQPRSDWREVTVEHEISTHRAAAPATLSLVGAVVRSLLSRQSEFLKHSEANSSVVFGVSSDSGL